MIKIITSGAVKVTLANDTTVILKCHRHADIFQTLKTLSIDYKKNSVVQGFIAWDGEKEQFVNRAEAARIAFAALQILKPQTALFTEDLW